MITDEDGYLVSEHKYLPFGEELTAESDINSHRFTGHERDQETNLDYMEARFSSSSINRFLSIDPFSGSARFSFPQSWNKYTYVMNNPINLFDPDGRAAVGFTGFTNRRDSGIRDIMRDVRGADGIGRARTFDHQDVQGAFEFVVAQHRANPSEAIVITGHSFGADSTLELAALLEAEGIGVDLTVTIDPVSGDKRVPDNVMEAINYFQTDSTLGGNEAYGGDGATISNVEVVGVNHGSIDNALADSGVVAWQMREAAKRRKMALSRWAADFGVENGASSQAGLEAQGLSVSVDGGSSSSGMRFGYRSGVGNSTRRCIATGC